MPTIIKTTSSNKNFQKLTSLLDKELRGNYTEAEFDFAKYNIIKEETKAILCMENEKAVGCGTFREIAKENTIEIKRMFVLPEARGKGYSKAILTALENWAKDLGYKFAKLETGNLQKAAIGLYQNMGYQIIPNYPPYEDVEDSICFRKAL